MVYEDTFWREEKTNFSRKTGRQVAQRVHMHLKIQGGTIKTVGLDTRGQVEKTCFKVRAKQPESRRGRKIKKSQTGDQKIPGLASCRVKGGVREKNGEKKGHSPF